MSSQLLGVGALVRHPDRPDWGIGQVQSVVDRRVTVNFENEGKVVFLGFDRLDLVEPDSY